MFGMIPFVKAAGRGLGALIKGRKGKETLEKEVKDLGLDTCLLYTSPSPRDATLSRMPSSA